MLGDEFSARLETLDGYAAVYDAALADYCSEPGGVMTVDVGAEPE